MNRFIRRAQPLLLAAACLWLHATPARADGPDAPAAVSESPPVATDDDSGFTILNNATNVTHWGLGVGAGYRQQPYAGDGAKFTPIPLIYFDDKWVHALGTALDLKIGKWAGVAVSLRVRYALGDGYNGSDAPILNGMQDRKGAFWYGPAFAWQSPYGALTGDLLTSANKGQQAHVAFGKSFQYGNLTIEPHAGVEWLSHKFVDYYYGVAASEAEPGRPAYTGTATLNASLGARFNYHFTEHQAVTFDVGVTRLGGGITNSPLVDKKFMPQATVGYLYRFN